jgi:hypothetical protein
MLPLCWPSFGLHTVPYPLRHCLNQLPTLLRGYLVPFHLNLLPQLMHTSGGMLIGVEALLEGSPEVFNWVQVWRLGRPHQLVNPMILQPLLCHSRGMLSVIVLLKDKITLPQTSPSCRRGQVLVQDAGILISIHVSLHQMYLPHSL